MSHLPMAESMPPPFHEGELEAQHRAGVAALAAQFGRRSIRKYMPDQHRIFFTQLPFFIVGGLDANQQPWATLRVGEPGFVHTLDERTLRINGGELPGDPLHGTWHRGASIGGLGIELPTRRRNRVNGVIARNEDGYLDVAITQSFGNCPRYIQSREPIFTARDLDTSVHTRSASLDADAIALLNRSDTLFIASAAVGSEFGEGSGVDVSHRGGLPGFIHIESPKSLTIPDFDGNKLLNTIGNLLRNPRAGLMVIDFDSGDLLYIAVRAEVVWNGAEFTGFPDAERLLRFHVEEVRRSQGVAPFQWSAVQYSPTLKNEFV